MSAVQAALAGQTSLAASPAGSAGSGGARGGAVRRTAGRCPAAAAPAPAAAPPGTPTMPATAMLPPTPEYKISLHFNFFHVCERKILQFISLESYENL